MNHLFTHRCTPKGWRRRSDLRFGDAQGFGKFISQILCLATPFQHHFFVHANGGGVFHIQVRHRQICADVRCLFAHGAQQIAHGDRHITKVDVHRARFFTTVANRAMIGDIFKLFPMFD